MHLCWWRWDNNRNETVRCISYVHVWLVHTDAVCVVFRICVTGHHRQHHRRERQESTLDDVVVHSVHIAYKWGERVLSTFFSICAKLCMYDYFVFCEKHVCAIRWSLLTPYTSMAFLCCQRNAYEQLKLWDQRKSCDFGCEQDSNIHICVFPLQIHFTAMTNRLCWHELRESIHKCTYEKSKWITVWSIDISITMSTHIIIYYKFSNVVDVVHACPYFFFIRACIHAR